MVFNRSVAAGRLADLAVAVGGPPGADGFLQWLVDLKKEIGIPRSLEMWVSTASTWTGWSMLPFMTDATPTIHVP